MPEGHVIHRLARELNRDFSEAPLHVSSPQGRFRTEAELLDAHPLAAAEAWGKHLFIDFDTDRPEHIVHIHLGLIGKLQINPLAEPVGEVRFRMATDELAADLRGPQWCRLITDGERDAAIDKLGGDPLREDSDPDATWMRLRRASRSIGALLMDQKLFAGVGNIYRAETLFRQGISPFTSAKMLDRGEFDAIWSDLSELMRDGVEVGRIDTVRPEHTPEAMGREPRKDDHGGEVYVYRRAGQPCYICGTPISETVMEGRNLFWCEACQPSP